MTKPTVTSYSLKNFDVDPEQQNHQRRKLLTFQVGQLNLALPIESVKKIVHHTAIQGSGTTAVGLVHLNDQEMTVIDLHKRLFKVSQPEVHGRQFLIMAQNRIQEGFCILVPQTPTLLELPLAQIRTLPNSYRFADTLDVASHVTRVQQAEEWLTVFILDVDRLVPPMGMTDQAS